MKNYPALKSYTSKHQYDALVHIRDNKSIAGLITDGRSSKTLGSLLRSQWIQEREYTDDEGVRRMGWFLTPDGENSIATYDAVAEAQLKVKKEQDRQAAAFMQRYPELHQVRKQKAELKERLQDLSEKEHLLANELKGMLYGLPTNWAMAIIETAKNRCLTDDNLTDGQNVANQGENK